MIQIGINEDVVLQRVEFNEKTDKSNASLSFVFEDGNNVVSDNPFDEVVDEETGMVITSASSNSVKLWCPRIWAETATKDMILLAEQAKQVYNDLNECRNVMTQYALCYTTTDKFKLDPWTAAGLTRENYTQMFTTEASLLNVFRLMCQSFVQQITPLLSSDIKLRALFVSQKNFVAFRNKFVATSPVVELAIIPIENSKLKFSDYEVKKGLNVVQVTTRAEADSLPTTDLNEASVFG
jgi:hypothetical protein